MLRGAHRIFNNVTTSSDEYNGLWLYFTLVEAQYREAVLLFVQGVNTMMTFVSAANQTYVLANNILTLANTVRTHNATQFLSGSHAATTYNSLTNLQAVSEGITDVAVYTGTRPTWRQSEIYASIARFQISMGYKYNESYIAVADGLEVVDWGTKGSVRPDFYNKLSGHCVDVKNYTITTSSGRSSLINNVVEQYNNRVSIFPEGTRFEVVIDSMDK